MSCCCSEAGQKRRVIRAATTNIGDSLHDISIGFAYSVLLVLLLLWGAIATWSSVGQKASMGDVIDADGYYWVTMFLAGVLGTLVGDAVSYALHLGALGATVLLGVPAVAMIILGRRGQQAQLAYYWTRIVIRSARTALGDLVAHGFVGIGPSTLGTTLLYVTSVLIFYELQSANIAVRNRRTAIYM